MTLPRINPVACALLLIAGPTVAASGATAPDALSLDEPWSCSAGNPIANAYDFSEGIASLQFQSPGYSRCVSPRMLCSSFTYLSDEVLIDVKLPAALPNPYWVGDLSLYIEAPSESVYNSWVGMTFLTGLPTDEWVTTSIPATQTLLDVLSGSCDDATLTFALNTSAPGVLVDNIRFAGDEPPVELFMTVAADTDDGQFDPSTSAISSGWSIHGERSGHLYAGSYQIDHWGGLGNGLTTTALRFALTDAIPAGAQIADAWLSLYGLNTWQWDSDVDALQVSLELSPDALPINGLADLPLSPTGRDLVATSIRWPEVGGLEWQAPGWNDSTNLGPMLQELIDATGGLEAGAHLQLYVYGLVADVDSEVGIADFSHQSASPATLTVLVD